VTWYRRCPNISKTVEIPTPKPCIFLFLVSSSIKWCVGHDHTEWSCPSSYRKWSNILKTVEIPTPYIFLFLVSSSICWYASHDGTLWSRPPLKRKCRNISKTTEIPTPKPYIFLFLVSSSIWWYVDHDHTKWSHGRPFLNRKCPIISKLLRSPPLNHRYKPVGLSGSDLPCTLHKIVCKCHNSVLVKVTQVSDVAHGPLVLFCRIFSPSKILSLT
jgi:hypothetical protein